MALILCAFSRAQCSAIHRYYPKVFLAKAGQHVHIPKGCLYMIRKSSSERLPEHDCHFELRKELGLDRNPVCISICHGWSVYRGIFDLPATCSIAELATHLDYYHLIARVVFIRSGQAIYGVRCVWY